MGLTYVPVKDTRIEIEIDSFVQHLKNKKEKKRKSLKVNNPR